MVAADIPLDLWERVLIPADAALAPEAARYFLTLDFTPADHARMADLSDRAAEGTLTPAEREELAGYVRVGHRLALLQSKARVALRTPPAAPGRG
jgi:hypothetical protein